MKHGLVAVTAAIALLSGCSQDTEIVPPTPTSSAAQDDSAQQVAAALARALRDHDATAAGELASSTARPQLQAAARNVGLLGLRLRTLRYLEPGVVAVEDEGDLPEGTWAATMQLVWRLPGWDGRDTRTEVSVLLDRDGGKTRVVGFAPGIGGRVPVWLTAPVDVRRAGRALVVTTNRQAGLSTARLLPLARQAVREVSETLHWRGSLVVEVPGDEQRLEQALAAGEHQYASIAAVTTTVDGSPGRGAPLHVFLNPTVFSRLGVQGAQVVMTHETVHVATQANASAAPDWLREGFADYVALLHAGVPVAKAGAQAIAKVRKQGPPQQLPTDADLAASAPHLGTAYEEAWLLCRFIARTYGEGKLIALYSSVDGGVNLSSALQQVLGTSEPALVKAWSRDMGRLAG